MDLWCDQAPSPAFSPLNRDNPLNRDTLNRDTTVIMNSIAFSDLGPSHIFSDSPQFQHTAPQFSQAVLSLCVCVVLPPLSLYSAQQHRKRAAAYARVEGLCIYIFGIAVLLFWRDVYKEKDTQLISLLPRRKKQQQQWKKSRASLVVKYMPTRELRAHWFALMVHQWFLLQTANWKS